MVKAKKNNLHLEVSNDVDLEYETATTTSRRMKKGKGKGKAQTKSKKISLKAKPKKSDSFLIVNGKKIPLLKSSKKSGRNKMSSKRGATKTSSATKKRAVSSKSGKRMVLQKKPSKKAIKKTAKVPSALTKKRAASSKTAKGKSLQKKDLRRSSSSKNLKTKVPAQAKKIMPSLDDIRRIRMEFFGVKDKTQKNSRLQSSSASAPAKKLVPSSSTNDTKKMSSDVNSLQSSSTDSENSGSKTIYMPIKQEANGQTAEAIIVEDKEEKADLQSVKLVVKAKKN